MRKAGPGRRVTSDRVQAGCVGTWSFILHRVQARGVGTRGLILDRVGHMGTRGFTPDRVQDGCVSARGTLGSIGVRCLG